MTVGERIKMVREMRGMTQEALGQSCDASKQTIYKYENNVVSNIPMDKVELIAHALFVDPAYLMGWTENMGEGLALGAYEKEFLDLSRDLPEDIKQSLLDLARRYVQMKEGGR